MNKKIFKIDLRKVKSKNAIDELTKLHSKNKTCKSIKVIDFIYPVKNLNRSVFKIKDHVNLSGENPLNGANFISLSDLYHSNNGIIVLGLKKGTHPNNTEKKILLEANISAYCYNLVSVAIYAASLGIKVNALGFVKTPQSVSYFNLSRRKSISSLVLK